VLRQAGLIESVRGRAGGYHLTRPPAEVHLGSVLLILGEPLFEDPSYCERHAGPDTGGSCVHHDGCTLRALWQGLDQLMRHVLDQVTLADLLRNEGQITELLRARLKQAADEPSGLVTLLPLGRE
jgi:Rrf2 family protein